MSRILTIIIISLIFSIIPSLEKSQAEEQMKANIIDLNKEFSEELKSYVIQYLKDNSLYKNETALINKKAFRKIFKEVLSTGDGKVIKSFSIFKRSYDKVCSIMIKDIFKKGTKYIKGSEVEKYLEYDYIVNRFNKYFDGNKEEDL